MFLKHKWRSNAENTGWIWRIVCFNFFEKITLNPSPVPAPYFPWIFLVSHNLNKICLAHSQIKRPCKIVFIHICVFLSFFFQHHIYKQIFNSNQFIFSINWSVYHYSKCVIIWSPSWLLKKIEPYVKKRF
jgi:hypothetical protein